MKRIYIAVTVPEEVDIFSLHEELLEERPEWDGDDANLSVFENFSALYSSPEEG